MPKIGVHEEILKSPAPQPKDDDDDLRIKMKKYAFSKVRINFIQMLKNIFIFPADVLISQSIIKCNSFFITSNYIFSFRKSKRYNALSYSYINL